MEKAPTHALAVVTKDMKYIYWGCAAEGFEATEELYDLDRDPLELTNQADNPEFSSVMQEMHRVYDRHLALWRAEAVPHNDYRRFGTLFDRNVPWKDKEALFNSPDRQNH